MKTAMDTPTKKKSITVQTLWIILLIQHLFLHFLHFLHFLQSPTIDEDEEDIYKKISVRMATFHQAIMIEVVAFLLQEKR
jgi:hypothetical protein